MSVDKTQMADFGRTQMVSPSAEVTQMAVSVTCPVCKTVSPGGEMYCSDCGFLLSSEPVEVAPVAAVEVGKLVDSTGRAFELKPGVNTIGRQDTDVLVSHPTVSRSHAKLTIGDGQFLLEDAGSTNGTFVGNAKVEPGAPVLVKPGAEILFGSALMRLEGPSAESAEIAAESAIEVEEAVEREELAEESVAVEEAAEIPPAPPVEAEAAEEAAAEESVEADMPISSGLDVATDATPAQSLEEPVEPVVIEEEAPLAKFVGADGTEYPVTAGENTIGRRATNAISVQDPYVSGSHAVIAASEGKFVLTDVGSTNGTFVNGEKLAPNVPTELVDGDEVLFAQVSLRFEVL